MDKKIVNLQNKIIQSQDDLLYELMEFNKDIKLTNKSKDLLEELKKLRCDISTIQKNKINPLKTFSIDEYNSNFATRKTKLEDVHKRKKAYLEYINNDFETLTNQLEIEKFRDNFKKKMAGFGGEISGIIRQEKSELSILTFNDYVNDNNIDLSYFTINTLKRFFKSVFDVSPTDRTLSLLLNSEKTGGKQLSNAFFLDSFNITENEIKKKTSKLRLMFDEKHKTLSNYNKLLNREYSDLYESVKITKDK